MGTLIYGHEYWAMTEGKLSQVQTAEMGFSRRVHFVTLCDKVSSCEICKTQNFEPILFQIDREIPALLIL